MAGDGTISTDEVAAVLIEWRQAIHSGIRSWELNGDPDGWFDRLGGYRERSRAEVVRDDMDRVIETLGGEIPEDDE